MSGIQPVAAAVVLLTAGALSLCLTPLVRAISRRFRVLDQPGPRKVHLTPTPLLGGWAVYLAFAGATVVALAAGWLDDGRLSADQVLLLLLCGLILQLGGTAEDKRGLSPQRQFLTPLAAVLLLVLGGVAVEVVTNPFGPGLWYLGLAAVWLPSAVAGVWLLGITYTTKLLDGLDGLVSGVGVIAALVVFAASLSWDVPYSGTALLALALGGACLGFLVYNWHPASIFLGEGGSTFIGFCLGVLAIISGAKIATAVLVMGLPILDTVWVIGRRLLSGQNPFRTSDRQHLHHRLLAAGLSHRTAVGVMLLVSATFGAVALVQRTAGKLVMLSALLAFMLALGLIVARLAERQDRKPT